jgi:RNA-binding proteins (RRM domain)
MTNRVVIAPPPPNAPSLLNADAPEKKLYWDRSHYDSPESQMKALEKSSTLYIGNLSFSTRVSHLKSLFSTIGKVKAIHMGLDRFQKTPCGFAFVEYNDRSHALDAVAFLSGSKLDGKVIRVELDAGFKPGRQYGRGASGGQVRDDRRGMIDPKRRSLSSSATAATKGKHSHGSGGHLLDSSIESRWEAPPLVGGDRQDDYYGPSSSHSQVETNSIQDQVGNKRDATALDINEETKQDVERTIKKQKFNYLK